MSQRASNKFETTFLDSFSSNIRYKEYNEYLSQYLEVSDGDPYWEKVYRKIIREEDLSDTEENQLRDLMRNVNVNEMLVSKLLGEDMADKSSDVFDKVEFVDANKCKLTKKWDIQFASTILEQFNKRGYISPKQAKQVERIYKALGGYDR